MVSQEYLKECMSYDESTGVFIWNERPVHHFQSEHRMNWWNSRFSQKVAGSVRVSKGSGRTSIQIKIDGSKYFAHRLAWLYVHGYEPDGILDHIDRDASNNRLSNLRISDYSRNRRNTGLNSRNSSGVKGVHWHVKNKRWVATICLNGKRESLGSFVDKEEAIQVRINREKELKFYDYSDVEMKK